MEQKIYNSQGKETGSVKLPESIFGLTWNGDLVHQVVTSAQMSARILYAHTKTRGEVRGGGRKPWQQKGLGKARHGSTRSPIWVGGGVAHGPRNDKTVYRKINKKMKTKALFTILSKKMRDGEIMFVDSLSMAMPKTKDAISTLNTLAGVKGFEKLKTKKVNAALISLPTKEVATEKSFKNIGKVEVIELRNANPVDLLNFRYIVMVNPTESFKQLEAKLN